MRVLVEEGPRYVRELIEWGARFDRDADGRPALGARSGAQRAARPARRRCDGPRNRPRALGARRARCRRSRRSTMRSSPSWSSRTASSAASGSSTAEGTPRDGARAARRCWRRAAPARCFAKRRTPRWRPATASRWRIDAGARVADLEFVQFHPTALNRAGAPRFLISEALRGEGARLVNARGEPFMTRYHPDGDLAPRDVVARSIVREAERDRRAACS